MAGPDAGGSGSEVQHLFAAMACRPAGDHAHRLRWSWRRRRQQARARACTTDGKPPSNHEGYPGSTEASMNSVEPPQVSRPSEAKRRSPNGGSAYGAGRVADDQRKRVMSCPRFGGSRLGQAGWTRPRRRARRESCRNFCLLPYSCSKPYAPALATVVPGAQRTVMVRASWPCSVVPHVGSAQVNTNAEAKASPA
jgi:hypothetical protein